MSINLICKSDAFKQGDLTQPIKMMYCRNICSLNGDLFRYVWLLACIP